MLRRYTWAPARDLNAGRIGFKPGGLVCSKATAGNMLVEGDVDARGAGVIEAAASGDLTANGDFPHRSRRVHRTFGGGTLDTAGGSFNPAPGPSCGVCPLVTIMRRHARHAPVRVVLEVQNTQPGA